jgi:hypothetical protein
MRAFLRSLLALFTFGTTMTGCNKPEPPPPAAPADVTLHVPGMY